MTADPTQDPESNNLPVTAVSYLLKQKSKTNFNRGYFKMIASTIQVTLKFKYL